MGIIRVNHIEVFGFHGCLPEEAIIGTKYIVDVAVHLDFTDGAKSDRLAETIDYVEMNRIVHQEMAIRARLIENVAYRILENMKKSFPMAERCWVKIAKTAAPMPGQAESVSVEMEL